MYRKTCVTRLQPRPRPGGSPCRRTCLLVEVVSVIRGRAPGGKLGPARAREAVDALPTLVIDQIDVAALLDRMWQLRGGITAYDAAYVAAAEALGCPLVTADARVAVAAFDDCQGFEQAAVTSLFPAPGRGAIPRESYRNCWLVGDSRAESDF